MCRGKIDTQEPIPIIATDLSIVLKLLLITTV